MPRVLDEDIAQIKRRGDQSYKKDKQNQSLESFER